MPALRELRLGRLWTQRELARAAGVAHKTVVDLELGRVEPQLKTMRKLAAALGVEPGEVDEFRESHRGKSRRLGRA